MRWLALALLLGCSTSRSAEREDSFAQQGESRREEGPVRVTETVEEYAIVKDEAGSFTDAGVSKTSLHKRVVTVTERAPVVVSSRSQTEASGEAKEAASFRWGWSPWTIAIGGLVALAGLYGLFRLKGKLGL